MSTPMISRVLAAMSLAAILGIACSRPTRRIANAPACAAGTASAWSVDSSISLCLPSGFTRVDWFDSTHVRWQRGTPVSASAAWISITIDTARSSNNEWPPRLGSTSSLCLADCVTSDSISRLVDTLAGGISATEVGLVSGGYSGSRRRPALVGGWQMQRGARVWVNGAATLPGTLDTLRTALRSIRVAGDKD